MGHSMQMLASIKQSIARLDILRAHPLFPLLGQLYNYYRQVFNSKFMKIFRNNLFYKKKNNKDF